MFNFLGTIAEYFLDLNRERTREGLKPQQTVAARAGGGGSSPTTTSRWRGRSF